MPQDRIEPIGEDAPCQGGARRGPNHKTTSARVEIFQSYPRGFGTGINKGTEVDSVDSGQQPAFTSYRIRENPCFIRG